MNPYQPKHFKLPADQISPGVPQDQIAPYLFSENIIIAMDVALATNRPLLISGPPGCGKTRLGETMAALLDWSFLNKTLTSRTRLEELTVEVDHLQRLHDAQLAAHKPDLLKTDQAYYKPGIFWWAFDPTGAAGQMLGCRSDDVTLANLRKRFPGFWRDQGRAAHHCVLLLDEIDKAEPDLPNDLLEPLDRRCFGLPNGDPLKANAEQRLLTLITTNQERELPRAFVRRCVVLNLELPSRENLVSIALKQIEGVEQTRVETIADLFLEHRAQAKKRKWHEPGTSEFLDAVQADHDLSKLQGRDVKALWQQISRVVLKEPESAAGRD